MQTYKQITMPKFPFNLNPEQVSVLKSVLLTDTLQYLIGAEEWDLTEDEEMILWDIIAKAKEDE